MDAKQAALLRRALAHRDQPQSVRRSEAPGVGPRVAREADPVVPYRHLYGVGSHGKSHLGLSRTRVLDDVVHRLTNDAVQRFFAGGCAT